MAEPGIQQYLDASSFAYNSGRQSGAPAGFSGTFAVNTQSTDPYVTINGNDAYDKANGFYGAAYTLDDDGATSIVISFEGTNLTNYKHIIQNRNYIAFSNAEIKDDTELFKGELPTALQEAATFTQEVIDTAAAEGIPASQIYLTGHSLGGAEAEYADAATQVNGTKLQGLTFGAPGIASTYLPSGTTSGLTDDVQYGDPVGNYASGTLNPAESSFIYTDHIEHYGTANYIGYPGDEIGLQNHVNLIKKGGLSEVLGLRDVISDFGSYHLLPAYAAQLGYSLTSPPSGATTFNATTAFNIVSGIIHQQNT